MQMTKVILLAPREATKTSRSCPTVLDEEVTSDGYIMSVPNPVPMLKKYMAEQGKEALVWCERDNWLTRL